jgi:hypothetical protein
VESVLISSGEPSAIFAPNWMTNARSMSDSSPDDSQDLLLLDGEPQVVDRDEAAELPPEVVRDQHAVVAVGVGQVAVGVDEVAVDVRFLEVRRQSRMRGGHAADSSDGR